MPDAISFARLHLPRMHRQLKMEAWDIRNVLVRGAWHLDEHAHVSTRTVASMEQATEICSTTPIMPTGGPRESECDCAGSSSFRDSMVDQNGYVPGASPRHVCSWAESAASNARETADLNRIYQFTHSRSKHEDSAEASSFSGSSLLTGEATRRSTRSAPRGRMIVRGWQPG
jgi:hypothetical protein